MPTFGPDLLPKVLSGEKDMTRRPLKENDKFVMAGYGSGEPAIVTYTYKPVLVGIGQVPKREVSYRLKYQIGRTYAIQPGRGKPAVARFELIGLRVELLQEITEQDAIREGFPGYPIKIGDYLGSSMYVDPVEHFREAWDQIYVGRPKLQWAANPWVVVLIFKLCASN